MTDATLFTFQGKRLKIHQGFGFVIDILIYQNIVDSAHNKLPYWTYYGTENSESQVRHYQRWLNLALNVRCRGGHGSSRWHGVCRNWRRKRFSPGQQETRILARAAIVCVVLRRVLCDLCHWEMLEVWTYQPDWFVKFCQIAVSPGANIWKRTLRSLIWSPASV